MDFEIVIQVIYLAINVTFLRISWKNMSYFHFKLDNIFYTKTFECFTEIVCYININSIQKFTRIDGVIVNILASSVIDRRFEPQTSQTKDYANGICCFSARHTSLRRMCKDWLFRNQDNVCVWRYVPTVVSVSQDYVNPNKRVGLV